MLDKNLDCDLGNNYNFSSKNENWKRVILLESLAPDMTLTKLSPFTIQKGICGIAGTVKDVKKLRSSQILVERSRKVQAENLLHTTTLANMAMKAFYHPSLHNSRGVIRTRELENMESKITAELTSQCVIDVKRITIKKGDCIKTGTYILTFKRPQHPERIQMGYLSVPVDIYT